MKAVLLCALVALIGAPSLVSAQDAPDEPLFDARAHFQRGTDFYNEGRLDAALAEFEQAYEVLPAYPVLYNVGRVHAELGHPVEAARAFARYLAEGGAEVPAARRTEVEALLATQRARIGRLRVESNVTGSIVSVDGVDVATTPIDAPLETGAGHHTVGVRAPGYEAVTRAIDLAGSVELVIAVELRPVVVPRGELRVRAPLHGLTVLLDGVEVGRTPLDATIPVPAGEHEIVGTRAGYLPDAHRVRVDGGAEVEVHLRPEINPSPSADEVGTLALALPHARAELRVDGESRGLLSDLTLPIGEHVLEIQMEDRTPWTGSVTIEPRASVTLAPPLTWTTDARRERADAAARARDTGIGLATAGGVMAVAGLVVLAWNETEIAATDVRVSALDAEYREMGCDVSITIRCQEIEEEGRGFTSRQTDQNVIRGITIGASVVGAVLAGVGVTLILTAPSDDEIDEAAHAELRVGPTGLEIVGTF